MSEPTPARHRGLEPEDEARAGFYALLGRLYAGAPDGALLALVARADPLAPAVAVDTAATELAQAWERLRSASAATAPEAAADEYQALFVGVGRSEVSPYASHYLAPHSGRPLAEIRAALAALGIARRPESSQFEDHIAVMLETMRMLAAGDAERPPAAIAEQREFFEKYIGPWVFECCAAITKTSVARYYGAVAEFTHRFLALERDSFAMD